MPRGQAPVTVRAGVLFRQFLGLMHILRVAGINDRDGIALYRVRKVPLELCSSLLTLDNAQIRFGIVLA